MKLLVILAVVVACASAEAYNYYSALSNGTHTWPGGYGFHGSGGYWENRGKRSDEAATPDAAADAWYGYYGHNTNRYRGYVYGGYYGHPYRYGYYRGKRSPAPETEAVAEEEAYALPDYGTEAWLRDYGPGSQRVDYRNFGYGVHYSDSQYGRYGHISSQPTSTSYGCVDGGYGSGYGCG